MANVKKWIAYGLIVLGGAALLGINLGIGISLGTIAAVVLVGTGIWLLRGK